MAFPSFRGHVAAALFFGTAVIVLQSVGAVKAKTKPPLHLESPYVVSLNASNWKEVVLESPHAVFVNIGRRECTHCINLVPEWEKLAESVDGLATIAYWDFKERKRPKLLNELKGYVNHNAC